MLQLLTCLLSLFGIKALGKKILLIFLFPLHYKEKVLRKVIVIFVGK
jgi:hypothetical protein